VIGAVGIVLSPWLVPVVFGSVYSHAVRTVQVMLVAIPFFFAANPLLAHVYTARLEHRRLGLSLGGVSFLGTGAVVAGQVLVGPVGAACGYVARAILVFALLALASSASGSAERLLRGGQPARDRRFGEVPG
jgi:O-antigen/teichoic acid export membrane protein